MTSKLFKRESHYTVNLNVRPSYAYRQKHVIKLGSKYNFSNINIKHNVT